VGIEYYNKVYLWDFPNNVHFIVQQNRLVLYCIISLPHDLYYSLSNLDFYLLSALLSKIVFACMVYFAINANSSDFEVKMRERYSVKFSK
jgi:hypothetical protein